MVIDQLTQKKLHYIIQTEVIPNLSEPPGERTGRISAQFLATPYQADSLIGGPNVPEELVINFNGVDCFTLLDYVHALKAARGEKEFIEALLQTRYREGQLAFFSRRHFFTDWAAQAPLNAVDITTEITPDYQSVTRQLNQKKDGSEYIAGLGIIEREIHYIPADKVNQTIISRLKTGDYIGIYTELPGLDVTHTGIFIAGDDGALFRNASSLAVNMKVVDSPFIDYVKNTPGIIVLRIPENDRS